MGLTKNFNIVSEYKHRTHEANEIYTLEKGIQKFVLTIDQERPSVVWLTGGMEKGIVSDRVLLLTFNLEDNGNLKAKLHRLPKLH